MSRAPDLTVKYDEDADVLYVALGAPVPAETDEDDNGLLVRYARSDGHPCGVTVLGFKDEWAQRTDVLRIAISEHLSLPVRSVTAALRAVAS